MAQAVAFRPHPGKQTEVYTTTCRYLLIGGGKKGGKTKVALGRFLRHVHDPRFRGLIVRQSIPGLAHIVDEARTLFRQVCPEVDHNQTTNVFTFPNLQNPREPGARIRCTFVESLKDCSRIEGWKANAIMVDEARQYTDPLVIDTLTAELYAEVDPATGKPWMEPWVILTSNPGGRGGTWIRKRFAIDRYPQGGVDVYDPATQTYYRYIHMTVRDNPSMDADKYIAGLRRFPPWKQKQMIDGDWYQKEGSAFEEFDPAVHVIDRFDWRGCEIHCACDFGYSTVCAVGYFAVNPDHYGTVCIDELTFHRTSPRDIARTMLALEKRRGYDVVSRVIGRDALGREDFGGARADQIMAQEGIHWRSAKDDRTLGFLAVSQRLNTHIQLWDGATVPALRFVRDRCRNLIQTLPILPLKPGLDDVDKEECKKAEAHRGIDHHYDLLRYHVAGLPDVAKQPHEDEPLGGWPRYREPSPAPKPRQNETMRGF